MKIRLWMMQIDNSLSGRLVGTMKDAKAKTIEIDQLLGHGLWPWRGTNEGETVCFTTGSKSVCGRRIVFGCEPLEVNKP